MAHAHRPFRSAGVALLAALAACGAPDAGMDGAGTDGAEGSATSPSQAEQAGAATPTEGGEAGWAVDFRDDFDTFDGANWQDQSIWVNDEDHCYVPGGAHGTREVSDGTLKIRVVDLGEPVECDSYSKTGERHPPTPYVAGRIITKNRQEFVKGRWTARLRVPDSGQDGMFPAWWLLGAQNDEPPVEDADETVCWPMTGSGEIDIFEHHSDGARTTTLCAPSRATARAVGATGSASCTSNRPTWPSGTNTGSPGTVTTWSSSSTATRSTAARARGPTSRSPSSPSSTSPRSTTPR
jgi:hypothetical protein